MEGVQDQICRLCMKVTVLQPSVQFPVKGSCKHMFHPVDKDPSM